MAFDNRFSIGKRRAAVVGPRHLENTGGTSDTFNSQAVSEPVSCPKVFDERFDCFKKLDLLFIRQVVKVDAKARQP